MHAGEVLGSLQRWLACRMQWKSKKHQTLNAAQYMRCLNLRGHAAAIRLASSQQGEVRANSLRLRHRGAYGRMRNGRGIGPTRAFLHVRKLIAQRRDTAVVQTVGNALHEAMTHSGASTMRKDIARVCARRPQQQARN